MISEPRSLDLAVRDPCRALLRPTQVQDLAYSPGTASTSATGSPACEWDTANSGGKLIASVITDRDLFVDTYRSRFFTVFVPIEVGGLPAVQGKTSADAPTCTTTVGVADLQSLDLTTIGEVGSRRDPCLLGRSAAEAIISNLPPKPP